MSEANRVSLHSIAETNYGTTPTAGQWQDMRYTSHSLAANPQSQVSNELRDDRMVSDLIKVGEQVGGEVGIEFSLLTYDDWLEALFGGTWTTDVLKNGTVKRSFSLEVAMQDWTATRYLQFKGMRIGTGALNFAYGQVAAGSFGFAGKEALESGTALVGSGTTTTAAKTITDVLNGSSDLSNIELDAGAPGSIIRAISLNVDNTLRPLEGIGTAGPQNQNYGRSRVTGSLEMYFDDIAMYAKLLANTTASLEWTVSDDTNSLTFLLPKIKFASGVPAVQGVDTDVMLPLEFEAIYDSGIDASIQLTRA